MIVENKKNIQVDGFISTIFLVDIVKLVNWLEKIDSYEDSETNISIYHNQLNFKLIKKEGEFKIIHIMYDQSIRIFGCGGIMEVQEIGNEEYTIEKVKNPVYNKYIIESKINDTELHEIIITLKKELAKLV